MWLAQSIRHTAGGLLLIWPLPSCHMQMCIPFKSDRNSYQVPPKLEFPQSLSFARTLKHQIYVSVHSFKQSAGTLTPVDRLALPEKRQTSFWRSEPPLIPFPTPQPDTHDHSWVSFSHLNPPFAQSTGGRVFSLSSVVAAKIFPAQINTFTVPSSGGKKKRDMLAAAFLWQAL